MAMRNTFFWEMNPGSSLRLIKNKNKNKTKTKQKKPLKCGVERENKFQKDKLW